MKAVNSPTTHEPLRHHNFTVAHKALQDKFGDKNCVILKGVEQSGKSTLTQALMTEYQENGISTVYITAALQKPSDLYAHLSKILKVEKTKKAIIARLYQFKKEQQYCLLALDQDGVNSSPQVKGILKQLCNSNKAILGTVKLLIVRQDYLVIPSQKQLEADFHHWITDEITLDLLHESDIDSYINHLANSSSISAPAYSLGTDTQLIELSGGRIGKLKTILSPLIHKDVITAEDLCEPVVIAPKYRGQSPAILAGAISLLLAITLAIYLAMSAQTEQEIEIEESKPIFADSDVTAPKIKAPYLSSGSAKRKQRSANIETPIPAPQNEPSQEILSTKTITKRSSTALTQKALRENITRTIDHWLLSWQTQNLNAYTQHYVNSFSSSYANHDEWRMQRQRSLSRPQWIKLQRSDLQDLLIEGNQATFRVWLKFESSTGYRDRTLKKIVLAQQNNQWLIAEEINELVRRGFE